MYKMILSWDIKPEQDQEYFEFMVREFAPKITSLGITPIEAWFSIYGDVPQIIIEGTAEHLHTIRDLVESKEWKALHNKLMGFVENYSQKVVVGRPDLQI